LLPYLDSVAGIVSAGPDQKEAAVGGTLVNLLSLYASHQQGKDQ